MKNRMRRSIVSAVTAAALSTASGCATLAHRDSVTGTYAHTNANCTGHGDSCPWLLGDALLLIPGIIPGVVAFAVDLQSGAWQHHSDTGPTEASLASDRL